jgi:CRP/FNR family transcriptional regulator, anaerobic regulatory protein
MSQALETFLPLSPDGRAVLQRSVHYYQFDAQEPVVHKGQAVSGAYLVTRGRLRVFTFSPQGTEATLYHLDAGETCVLALNCLFNDLRYPAWVESDAGTQVALIPGKVYRNLFESEAAVRDLTVSALSTLVFRLMGELEQLHACNLDQRLANFLLVNSSGDGNLHMTQQTIASHLGTSREVIARLVRGFVAQGCIETGRGVIRLRDTERLRNWQRGFGE